MFINMRQLGDFALCARKGTRKAAHENRWPTKTHDATVYHGDTAPNVNRSAIFDVPTHGPPTRSMRKIAGCACAGNAGNDFPATHFKGNHQLVVPACITARASRTCRDRLTHRGGENIPGIPGACATRKFTYLARGPCCACGINHHCCVVQVKRQTCRH